MAKGHRPTEEQKAAMQAGRKRVRQARQSTDGRVGGGQQQDHDDVPPGPLSMDGQHSEPGALAIRDGRDGVVAARDRKDIYGSEDFYVDPGGTGSGFVAAKELIHMPSDDPAHYLPLSNIDLRWLLRNREIVDRRLRMRTGHSDPDHYDWRFLAGSVAIDGKARTEFIQVVTAEHYMRLQERAARAEMGMTRGDRGRGGTNSDRQPRGL